MGPVLMTLLIGVGFAGLMDLFSSDDDAPPEGEELKYDGSDTLVGTEGDDSFTTDDQDPGLSEPTDIHLLGGDDVAEVNTWPWDSSIHGGDGDDVIGGTGAWEIYGDAGNDELSTTMPGSLYGGTGDDQLTLDNLAPYDGGLSVVDGGEGNDRIILDQLLAGYSTDMSVPVLTGGEGDDEFDLNLYAYNSEGHVSEGVFAVISDFTPGEDKLNISLAGQEGNGYQMHLDEVSVTDHSYERDGETIEYSLVNMSFLHLDTNATVSASLYIEGQTGISMDDIVLVQR